MEKQKWLIIPVMTLLIAAFSWQCSKKEDATVSISDTQVQSEAPATQKADDETPAFIPYDEAPSPIGGYAAIQKRLTYPALAKKAGIEGKVVVYAFINEKGDVIKTKIAESLGNNGCDEAAVKAIKSVKWKPALSKDKNVAVWVAVPVKFTLK